MLQLQDMLAQEIERKFLVQGDFKPFSIRQYKIVQGYLSLDPKRSVRIRIREDKAFLTIKGISNETGTTRLEWEKPLEISEAEQLLRLCGDYTIEKTRYIIPVNDILFFEVDEFMGANEGLVIAEIELPDEATYFEKPTWLGAEVTHDYRYYNINLIQHPFTKW